MNNNDSYPSATQVDLFEENEFVEYTEASNNQRFFNYLIDYLFIQFILGYLVGFVLGMIFISTSPETFEYLFGEDSNQFMLYVIALFNHVVYYTISEKAFRGYTLGKAITGTRAIREDGGELTLKDAFVRSVSRIVPFEAFSIWFGDGMWHDTWSKTKVIKTR